MFANKITGSEGKIEIVELGAVIGQFSSWSIWKERKDEALTGRLIFRGELKYINRALYDDPDYQHAVTITFSRDRKTRQKKQYRIMLMEDGKVSFNGRVLLMEGAEIHASS